MRRNTQEGGRWPFLTPRLENVTEKTREDAPLLVKQIWDFLEEQLGVAEKREMTVGRFVTAANEVTIGGFWREHARGELRTRRDHEILGFLSPCWKKEFLAGMYSAKETHRNYEVAELLKFWTEKIMEIDPVERERPSLGLILERTPEVISVPRSSKRVELKMGNGNDMLTTNLGVVWKLLRPSWCPHPHASLIEEVTERVRLAPTEDEDLATLSIVHILILPQVKESSEMTSGTGLMKKMEPGSCLDSTCGNGEHTCDGRSCVRIQSFQKEDLVTWFEDITEREKSEIQIVAECYASTTVNLATALGFFSRMCSLQSLERLESEHHLVTALSVESWPGVLQVTQKHIKSWKVGLEAEMGFPMSEDYGLPLNAKSLVGSVMAILCGSHYPLHMAMVEVSSQRVLIDKASQCPNV